MLCVSGGGKYAAFTAGALCGWTSSGTRPEFDVATGDVRLCGSIVDIDETTGRATAIRRLVVRENELSSLALSPAEGPPLM